MFLFSYLNAVSYFLKNNFGENNLRRIEVTNLLIKNNPYSRIATYNQDFDYRDLYQTWVIHEILKCLQI